MTGNRMSMCKKICHTRLYSYSQAAKSRMTPTKSARNIVDIPASTPSDEEATDEISPKPNRIDISANRYF